MSKIQKESHLRSLLKGITWRITGTVDTLVISWFVISEGNSAGAIAIWDTGLKFMLFYVHERFWQNIPLGMVRSYRLFRSWAKHLVPQDYRHAVVRRESHIRSIIKGISWRIIGTATTIAVAYIVTGSTASALKIGGIEIFTKLFLYYLHERAWQLVSRGKIREVTGIEK